MKKQHHNWNIPEGKDWIFEQYVTLGKTITQIAKEFNCGRWTIRNRLIRCNIPRIATVKGKRNGYWSGDNASVKSIHDYIRRWKPKPEFCEECGKRPPAHLSNNKNHKYTRNIDDYNWLCCGCHMIKDGNVLASDYKKWNEIK